jgi:hypothetical protein
VTSHTSFHGIYFEAGYFSNFHCFCLYTDLHQMGDGKYTFFVFSGNATEEAQFRSDEYLSRLLRLGVIDKPRDVLIISRELFGVFRLMAYLDPSPFIDRISSFLFQCCAPDSKGISIKRCSN